LVLGPALEARAEVDLGDGLAVRRDLGDGHGAVLADLAVYPRPQEDGLLQLVRVGVDAGSKLYFLVLRHDPGVRGEVDDRQIIAGQWGLLLRRPFGADAVHQVRL